MERNEPRRIALNDSCRFHLIHSGKLELAERCQRRHERNVQRSAAHRGAQLVEHLREIRPAIWARQRSQWPNPKRRCLRPRRADSTTGKTGDEKTRAQRDADVSDSCVLPRYFHGATRLQTTRPSSSLERIASIRTCVTVPRRHDSLTT